MFSGRVARRLSQRTGCGGSRHDRVCRHRPFGCIAAVTAGEVEDDEIEGIAAVEHGAEGFGLACEIPPHEGVVIERIGKRHHLAQHPPQPRQLLRLQRWEFHIATDGGIRHQRGFAPEQLIDEIEWLASGPATCSSFRVSSSAKQGLDTAKAEAGEHGVGDRIAA